MFKSKPKPSVPALCYDGVTIRERTISLLTNMWRRVLVSAFVLFILMVCPFCHAQLTLNDCREAGELVRCGTLRVPENRSMDGGRRLDLSIIVVPYTGHAQASEPLFVLKGGPGEAATSDAEYTLDLFRALRAEHDLVLLDQRGTGATGLQCDVADHAFLIPRDPEQCLAQLRSKADLRLYTTEHFVEDLDAARKALGYEQISLWAGSYGTRAAYIYATKYPERIRSLVLIAPAPLSMPVLDAFEEDGRVALDALTADCVADRACGKAFPRVRADVRRLRDGLTDRFDLIGFQALLYSSGTSRWIPFLASRAAVGDRAPLEAAIAQVRRQLIPRLSIGLHLAVFCSEDFPFRAPGASLNARSFLRAEYDIACRGWPVAQLPKDFHAPMRIDRPALLIAGEWDPATSPRWTRIAAGQFSRSQVVIVPKEGHTLERISACVGEMTRQFLERGNADASCALRLKPLPYRMP
jgi:pimeloyl-ACP methyl ester carboxylesterase